MADGLVIKDDVVQSFINDCYRGISMLSSSTAFTESMADAAGPNGGLKSALNSVEGEWSIRREKLLDSFEKLMETIAELRSKYAELDAEMAQLLERRGEDGPDCKGPGQSAPVERGPVEEAGPGEVAPVPPLGGGGHGGGTAPGLPPLGGAGGGGGQGGGSAGDHATVPYSATTDLPPFGADTAPHSTGGAVSPLDSILAFADRWALLTGRTREEVVALLVAGMGVTGLIPAAMLAELGKRTGATVPGEVVDGGTPPADGAGQAPLPEGGAAADGDLADGGQASGPGGGEDPTADLEGGANDAGLSEDETAPDLSGLLSPDPEPAVDGSPSPGEGDSSVLDPATEVALETSSDLQPELSDAAAAAPLELPDLESTPDPDATGTAGGSSGVELPPLEGPADAGGGAGGTASPLELPDLTLGDATSAEEPSNGSPLVDVSDVGTASAGAAALAAPMAMRGAAGIGAVGGLSAGVSAPTPLAAAGGCVQKDAERREAREVLDIDEEDDQ